MTTNRFSGIFQASGRLSEVSEAPEPAEDTPPKSAPKAKPKSKRRKSSKRKPKPKAKKPPEETSALPPVPRPAKSSDPEYQRTTIYIPKEIHQQLKLRSTERGMDMSDVFTSLVKQWLETPSLDATEAVYALAHPHILPDPPPRPRFRPEKTRKRNSRKSDPKTPIEPIAETLPVPEPVDPSPPEISPDPPAIVSRLANRAKLAANRRKQP